MQRQHKNMDDRAKISQLKLNDDKTEALLRLSIFVFLETIRPPFPSVTRLLCCKTRSPLAPRHHHSTPLRLDSKTDAALRASHFKTYPLNIKSLVCFSSAIIIWFWSCLPLGTATCLHSVSYTTLFFWHPHAENQAIYKRRKNHRGFRTLSCLDCTCGINSHKTLYTAQPCHLLNPNWKTLLLFQYFRPN